MYRDWTQVLEAICEEPPHPTHCLSLLCIAGRKIVGKLNSLHSNNVWTLPCDYQDFPHIYAMKVTWELVPVIGTVRRCLLCLTSSSSPAGWDEVTSI